MKVLPLASLAFALCLTAGRAEAQVERLSLEQMIARTDDAVYGTITEKHVIRIDHKRDGPDLYFTSLTIEGKSL